ncbi:MAG TPA: CDP-alcohol phosphatidyltransferase family protein [Chthoniobacterales bacterium]
MILPEAQSRLDPALIFKTYDTEELADIYFFRPLGMAIARTALACRLTPNQITLLAGIAGTVAGLLLYDESLGLYAFGLLILHGIIDSADGQLARMTGQITDAGFFLDGLSDYCTDIAICLGIAAGILHRGGPGSTIAWALLAILCIGIQGMMYVYHRSAYASVVAKGIALENDPPSARAGLPGKLRAGYLSLQQCLISGQAQIARLLHNRTIGPTVRDDDRIQYARCFYWPKRGWNLLGANTRFYVIGALAWMHRLDRYFFFILVPMNLAALTLWLWQRRADRRFLASL